MQTFIFGKKLIKYFGLWWPKTKSVLMSLVVTCKVVRTKDLKLAELFMMNKSVSNIYTFIIPKSANDLFTDSFQLNPCIIQIVFQCTTIYTNF